MVVVGLWLFTLDSVGLVTLLGVAAWCFDPIQAYDVVIFCICYANMCVILCVKAIVTMDTLLKLECQGDGMNGQVSHPACVWSETLSTTPRSILDLSYRLNPVFDLLQERLSWVVMMLLLFKLVPDHMYAVLDRLLMSPHVTLS